MQLHVQHVNTWGNVLFWAFKFVWFLHVRLNQEVIAGGQISSASFSSTEATKSSPSEVLNVNSQ